ncbi:MAG TPA: ornithine cyclodeaminase family protein [Thermodesulfobacteriota bacterium]|nr:ornithine cyclodeaminase family protein [Thermodesulfobacteriota bacterium]
MVLFLGEKEVEQILTMSDAVRVLEETFRQQGLGNTINHSRQRVRTQKSMLHYLAGAVPHMGVMGYKAYTSYKGGVKFRVFLHNIETGELLSIMDGDYMGMIRTGATTAVATKYMARINSEEVGIFGTGWQARGQLMGVCEVREIKKIKAYSRDVNKKKAFCNKMGKLLGIEVIPTEKSEDVVSESDIIITSTTSFDPVFQGEWLEENGVHINAIGGNFLFKREIDEATVRRSNIIVVESKEQSKIEAGEFLPAIEKGRLHWDEIYELGEIVAGGVKGRKEDKDITLFKSLGIAIEDIAVAAHVYELAKARALGQELPIPSI